MLSGKAPTQTTFFRSVLLDWPQNLVHLLTSIFVKAPGVFVTNHWFPTPTKKTTAGGIQTFPPIVHELKRTLWAAGPTGLYLYVNIWRTLPGIVVIQGHHPPCGHWMLTHTSSVPLCGGQKQKQKKKKKDDWNKEMISKHQLCEWWSVMDTMTKSLLSHPFCWITTLNMMAPNTKASVSETAI